MAGTQRELTVLLVFGKPGALRLMNSRHRRILHEIFANPVSPAIPWLDIESLLIALGAIVKEGAGSRVNILLNGCAAVLHRPHPQKETDKGAVKSVRRFLTEAGIQP